MHVRNSTDVGALIRDRRHKLSLDQRTLAARIGVSRQWLIEVERGKPRAEVGLVLRALEVLHLAVDVRAREGDLRAETADIDAVVSRARKPRP